MQQTSRGYDGGSLLISVFYGHEAISMDKREFGRRLERAAERAREFAQRYVEEVLPPSFLYVLPEYDDPQGRRGPEGTMKYFGGRFLRAEDLSLVTSARATDLLWVDGRLPAWINVNVESVNPEATVIRMRCSRELHRADEDMLGRDIPTAVDPDDPVEPFRIRGPAVPQGWRSVEEDGRISLLNRGVP
jgi:hypothetical protein